VIDQLSVFRVQTVVIRRKADSWLCIGLEMSNSYVPWRKGSGSPNRPALRAQTAGPSGRRAEQAPMLPQQPTMGQPQSCRQLLAIRLQKYRWSATFQVEPDGPQHNQRWRGVFRVGEITIGVSGHQPSKALAKEEAAQSALSWLNEYGYV
jgi:hypothetical protein